MSRIKDVKALQLFDSRGLPTLEVQVETDDGHFRAMVPSGTFATEYEAKELRDNDQSSFQGQGVLKAIKNVNNELAVAIIGMDPTDQEGIDQALLDVDGSDDNLKGNMGANAILGVSMAVARAGAAKKDIPLYRHINNLAGNPTIILPTPAFNVISTDLNSQKRLLISEFLILPTGAETFKQAMNIGVEVYQTLKTIIKERYGEAAIAIGGDGGFVPNLKSGVEGLELVKLAVQNSGYEEVVQIAIDAAASRSYNRETGHYHVSESKEANGKAPSPNGTVSVSKMSATDLMLEYKNYAVNYQIVSVEDPFEHEDSKSFEKMTAELGEVIQVVGDDFLSTNMNKVETAIEQSACNGVLLKLNQIGTVTEAIEINNLARNAGFGVMVSHRDGETEDPFIAAFAAGLGTGQIKSGAPCRSDRLAKYNELLRIEDDMGGNAVYAGDYWRDPWMLQPSNRGSSYM